MPAAGQGDPPPSVIMIYTDDMGYGDISSFSNKLPVKTPNINRLATEGKKFTNFYVSMPICSPSRAAVLSGMYSPRNRLTNYLQERQGNYNSDGNDWMDPELAYLPKSFKAAGYATAHVGKWHLGGGRDVDNAPSIAEYGYDEFYSTWESPNPDPGLGVKYAAWDRNIETGQVIRHRRTEYMVNRTLDFLNRHGDQPCFVTLWPDDLHTPFRPSPDMIQKYGGDPNDDDLLQNFYGVLDEYDRQIGRLLAGLDLQGRTTNSIVFFTGDNGPSPNYTNHMRTDGMTGRKLSLHEGGVREPFMIRWPGHIPAGVTDSETIMSTVDLLKTLTSLAGVPISAEAALATDGEDLSAAVLGAPVARQNPLFWEYGRTGTVPRPGAAQADWSPPLAMREGDYKLMVKYDGTGAELYNLRTDRNELTNIAGSNAALVNSMKTRLLAWSQTLPHRDQPFPAFTAVDFSRFSATEVASIGDIQSAAGASGTSRISGVACDPNGSGDVFVMHTDLAGKETLLRLDDGVGPVTKITDSDAIAAALGVPTQQLELTGGFEYTPGGNRVYLGDRGLGATAGQTGIISVEVSSGFPMLITRTANLEGLADLTALPDSTILVARGDTGGNNSAGIVNAPTGAWTQTISQTYLLNNAPGQTSLNPLSIAASNSTGQAILAADGADTGSNELFKLTNPMQVNPGITRQAQAALAGTHFTDLSMDQAGNAYGFSDATNSFVIIRANDSAVYFIAPTQVQSKMGSMAQLVPVSARGLAGRMMSDKQADLFVAGSSGDHGIVRLRFGTPPAAVDDWSLYVQDDPAD
jgi:arylsulfatase A-like enzyme